MVDPKLGRQALGVPLPPPAPEARPPPRRSLSSTHDEPVSVRLGPSELDTLLAHLQGVEERYQAALGELRTELEELRERTTKIPSTPPGSVDISKGPQGLRVRGPAGYALAISLLLFGAAVLWGAKPVVAEVLRQLAK